MWHGRVTVWVQLLKKIGHLSTIVCALTLRISLHSLNVYSFVT